MEKHRNIIVWISVAAVVLAAAITLGNILIDHYMHGMVTEFENREKSPSGFWVVDVPTPNVSPGSNSVLGIVLHHTACVTGRQALEALTSPTSKVSCHVMIDTDGSRYVLALPEAITWHAGRSRLNGKDWCNKFTIGIEFQGNTLENPLTYEQIKSAIEYMLPIIKKYGIPLKNIVTHEQIRENYKKAHPNRSTPAKVDITPEEYARFMTALKAKINAPKTTSVMAASESHPKPSTSSRT